MTQVSLGEQLKALEQLQELDLKIDHLKKTQGGLPGTLKALEDKLAKARQAVAVKQTAADEIKKLQSQTRAALELNRDRLTRSTTRLESVSNSQEYQAVSKEIEQLKKHAGTLEEQLKKSEEDLAGITQQLTTLSADMEKIQQERDQQASVVSGESGKLQSEVSTLVGERAQYTSKVEPRTLALYDRVRVARAGLGIVPTVGGRCKGCNMVVPPQLHNEIRKQIAMHSCPSCHRLLYVAG